MSTLLHWHEGLFLQPHHLQRFQKTIFDQFSFERTAAWAYPYGVLEARVSHDDLENHQIKFERLKVVMPDGCHVDFPANAELPSLDIRDAFANSPRGFVVYLGIPDWFDARANTVPVQDDSPVQKKLRYRVVSPDPMFADENTGDNEKPIQVRRINARLILDYHDDSDMQKIPLLRVIHDPASDEPVPRQDPEYVYPCLHLGASPTLREMVRDLSGQVSAVRSQLSNVLSRGGFDLKKMGGLQFEQVLRLRTLNKFAYRLPAFLDAGNGLARVPTFDMYLELRDLLADLMALFPDRGDFDALPNYDHDDPYPCFHAIITQIRNFLHGAVKPQFMKIDFKPGGKDGLLSASLEDEHFAKAQEFFLAVETSLDRATLTDLVEDPDQFKLAPPRDMERNLRGLPLKEELYPPLDLPQDRKRFYYRLTTSETRGSAVWTRARKQQELVVRWTTDFDLPAMKLVLYMTLSNTGADAESED